MLFNSSVLAVTLASSIFYPSTSECIPCQQETVYMPGIPQPEMTFSTEPIVKEIALAPDDSALTYYMPLEESDQLPSKSDILDLLKGKLQKLNLNFGSKEKGVIVDVYPASAYPDNQGMLAADREFQTGANKIESLKPSAQKTKRMQQHSKLYTI